MAPAQSEADEAAHCKNKQAAQPGVGIIPDHTSLAAGQNKNSTITGASSLMRAEVRTKLQVSHIAQHYG